MCDTVVVWKKKKKNKARMAVEATLSPLHSPHPPPCTSKTMNGCYQSL